MTYLTKDEVYRLWNELDYRNWKHLRWKLEDSYKNKKLIDSNIAYQLSRKIVDNEKQAFPQTSIELYVILNNKLTN